MENINRELVVYKNELNSVSFKGLSPVEMDLFFAVCSQAKETNSLTVRMDLDKVRRISGQYTQSLDRFMAFIEQMNDNIQGTSMKVKTDSYVESYALFTYYKIDNNDLVVDVNPRLAHVINNIKSDFTQYELDEFVNINSKYTKTIFRQLKQFKDTGLYIVSMDKFKFLLDVPKSYRMTDIDRQILNPSLSELSNIFENLKLEKIKSGRKISKLKFTFKKQEHEIIDVLPDVPLYNWLEGNDVE
ncbi:replication initiation protein [Vagococcus vulneris]|uniref:Initiator Rep protein WH1 domain-containing protein n=1 Tax=Vagococcus vulneris TaxID=1977869 RepID=A0A429ZQU3_9ENTE|nr:replication initiation protein [Vagococcus vulneris]RST96018.1 hypothetical protein CBF37_11275 [Vagococcus vulneris]